MKKRLVVIVNTRREAEEILHRNANSQRCVRKVISPTCQYETEDMITQIITTDILDSATRGCHIDVMINLSNRNIALSHGMLVPDRTPDAQDTDCIQILR